MTSGLSRYGVVLSATRIGVIKLAVAATYRVFPVVLETDDQLSAQHSGGPSDEPTAHLASSPSCTRRHAPHTHVTTVPGPGYFSGSHQWWFSVYH